MEYMIQFFESGEHFAKREASHEASQEYWGAWTSYIGSLMEAGIVVNGHGLLPPSTATTVRIRDGKRQVQDGPFAETKEMLGGYFVINVPDLDAALEWAARSPSASYGSTEVRPVMPEMD